MGVRLDFEKIGLKVKSARFLSKKSLVEMTLKSSRYKDEEGNSDF